jgi:hypothetical protein
MVIDPNKYNIGKCDYFYMYIDVETPVSEGNETLVLLFWWDRVRLY